ncbi:hypothetical protein BO71DRAFT_368123 [Aspergillus ellipticus CBS 707.79]|uniref:Uncharacterized protein n=1 Tax=Aspergillus ellipticus CBS 707.79 TaxID=1448320 RepID=A0A319E0H7_9EURO|nr:hypothetical protein BO71DRAFT_368123 [Aspergillus ellipticus CBS 707.79]
MVNWKVPEATDRLFAALIAAHTGLKLDYHAMAILFDQGATYDAIEGRFRKYRKLADELRQEANERGVIDIPKGRSSTGSACSTPRTPRGPRNGIQKISSSSRRQTSLRTSNISSPTKFGLNRTGQSVMEAICVDDDSSRDEAKVKKEPAASTSCDSDIEIITPPPATIFKDINRRSGTKNPFFSPRLKSEQAETLSLPTIPDHVQDTHAQSLPPSLPPPPPPPQLPASGMMLQSIEPSEKNPFGVDADVFFNGSGFELGNLLDSV